MSNVPKLRFKEFSGEWDKVKIQTLIDKKFIKGHLDGNHGALYPKAEEFTKEGIPYVTANDFINGKVDLNKCKCLPIERASQFKKGIAKDGDVLFAHNATVGPVALLETDLDYVILSTTATYFRCDNENLINNYLKVYFTTNDFIKQYSRVMSQSTRDQVPITTQRLFNILLPSKQEQEKIASFLTSVDTKIEQLTKKEELLKQYKKGVMQQIFSGEIRFKADDGSEFEDWEEKKLGDVGEFKRGKNLPQVKDGQYFLLGMGSVSTEGKLLTSNTSDDSTELVEKNDLIMPERDIGEGLIIGRVALINKDNNYVLGANVLRLRPKEWINSIFLHQYINDETIRRKIRRLVNGSAQLMITGKEIKEVQFHLPCLEEQTKIANFLSLIDSKIEQVQKQLDSTKEFKKALLQQMFV